MNTLRAPAVRLWLVLTAVFAVFIGWYDYSGGPLTPEEIAHYEARLLEQGLEGTRVPEAVRVFAEGDDGDEFFMINLESYRSEPLLPEGFPEDADPYEVEREYSVPTMLLLLKRACHPVAGFLGRVNFIDYEGAPVWERLLLVRYRSRRDFLEIFAAPQTARAIEFKFVFLSQGHSWPSRTEFSLMSYRTPVFLGLLAVGGVAHGWLALRARRRTEEA